MNNKKKYYISEKEKKKIYLEDVELEAFALLAKQRLLSTDQMYKFISSRTRLKESSYKSKFFKSFYWKDLVFPLRVLTGQIGKKNFYRIGSKGVELLIREGYLDKHFINLQIDKFSNLKNIDHFIATQDIIVNAFDSSFREDIKLECINDVKDLELKQSFNGDIANLKPDTSLKINNHYIHVEMDMGTEQLSIINEKAKKYIELCKNNPKEQHSIVFSVIDNSFEEGLATYTEKPERRIRNMKEAMLSLDGLHHFNLSIYVTPFARTHDLVFKMLKGEKPYKEDIVMNNIETVAEIFSYANESFGYIFEPIDLEDVFPNDTPLYYIPDKCYKVNNKAGTAEHYVMFLFLEEGSVQHLDRLRYLHHIMGKTKVPIRKIIVLYHDSDELSNDIVGQFKFVLFGDGLSLSETTEENPTFLRSTSPFRMGETSYEGV